jgi:two-component system, NtrC family, sensor kinase
MRLAHRLGLLIALAVAVVLAANGYFRMRREIQSFDDDIRRDHQVLGEALAAAAASVASRGDPESAIRFVNGATSRHHHITTRWVPHRAGAPAVTTTVTSTRDEQSEMLVTQVPLNMPGVGPGTVEIRESIRSDLEYVRETLWRVVTVTLLAIVLTTLVVVVVIHFMVGAPLRRIMDLVRRVGRGDLTSRVGGKQSGEMGELARELDTMCEKLAAAIERADKETKGRIATLEQLRHADRLSTVGQLASGIAHELGTPLNVVAARAKMIEREESRGPDALDDARTIREQADRMTRIIRQLLDFARQKSAVRLDFDLNALVTRTLTILAPLASKARVRLEPQCPPEPVVVGVDLLQMEQVLTNLVINAIQAQPDGGVVRLRVSRSEGSVVVEVEDEGEGMTEEVKARVFEPFFTTKDVGRGTGLGLSVVYGIVQEHGGRITIDSEPGQGAKFTVVLPAGAEGGA